MLKYQTSLRNGIIRVHGCCGVYAVAGTADATVVDAKLMQRIAELAAKKPLQLDIFKKLVNKMGNADFRAQDIPALRIHLTEEKDKNYVLAVAKVAELKHECRDYENYLQKKLTTHKASKDYAKVEKTVNKLATIQTLSKPLDFSDVEKSITEFEKTFTSNKDELKVTTSDDERDKRFKRITLAILTGGLYALFRGLKLGTAQFWKSRPDVFTDKIEENMNLSPKK